MYMKYYTYSSVLSRSFIGQTSRFEYFRYEVGVTHSGTTLSSLERFFQHVQDIDFAHLCVLISLEGFQASQILW